MPLPPACRGCQPVGLRVCGAADQPAADQRTAAGQRHRHLDRIVPQPLGERSGRIRPRVVVRAGGKHRRQPGVEPLRKRKGEQELSCRLQCEPLGCPRPGAATVGTFQRLQTCRQVPAGRVLGEEPPFHGPGSAPSRAPRCRRRTAAADFRRADRCGPTAATSTNRPHVAAGYAPATATMPHARRERAARGSGRQDR